MQGSWANIASVGLVESQREVGGKVSIAQRLFLTSLPCDAVRFAQAVRDHWGMENALPWGLDVSFREDEGRIRQGPWSAKYGRPAPYGLESVATRREP